MLKSPARNPRATPSPKKRYGVVATRVSGNACGLINAPWNRAENDCNGSAPLRATARPATTKPATTEITGSRTAEAIRRERWFMDSRLCSSRHHQADLFSLGGLALEQADDLAAIHHRHSVGQ